MRNICPVARFSFFLWDPYSPLLPRFLSHRATSAARTRCASASAPGARSCTPNATSTSTTLSSAWSRGWGPASRSWRPCCPRCSAGASGGCMIGSGEWRVSLLRQKKSGRKVVKPLMFAAEKQQEKDQRSCFHSQYYLCRGLYDSQERESVYSIYV